MRRKNNQEISATRLLQMKRFESAEKRYAREGKTQAWIANKLGDAYERIGWYHIAAKHYRQSGMLDAKQKIIALVKKIKEKGWLGMASEIAVLGGVVDDIKFKFGIGYLTGY